MASFFSGRGRRTSGANANEMSLGGGAPFQWEQAVEQATPDRQQREPDWELLLSITDALVMQPEQGATLLKLIKKRLQNKHANVQLNALVLLESCVKNGKDAFHELVAAPDMVKLMSELGTTHKDEQVRTQALALIQDWYQAFSRVGLDAYTELFTRLRNKGTPFPDPASRGAVLTPVVNQEVLRRREEEKRQHHLDVNRGPHPLSWTSPEYVQKITNECVQAHGHLVALRDQVNAARSPAEIQQSERIRTLASTAQDIRNRASYVLVEIEHETLLDLVIQLSELARLAIEFYQARLTGRAAEPPQLPVPRAAGTASSSSSSSSQSAPAASPIDLTGLTIRS